MPNFVLAHKQLIFERSKLRAHSLFFLKMIRSRETRNGVKKKKRIVDMKYFLPLVIPYETAFAKDRADVEHRALLGGSWLLFVCGCVTFVLSSSYIHIQLELVRSSNISE